MDIYQVLYKKILIVVDDYNKLYNIKLPEYKILNLSLKDLNDFINMNRLYININIQAKSYDIEKVISGILTKALRYDDITFKKNYENEVNKTSELILELERLIKNDINN